jgi:hypothetical protein
VVDSSIYKVVAERGGGSTEVDTAAAATVVVAVPATPATLPSFLPPPSFFCSLHYLIYRLL